jgi:excinuclease ABC subunit C
MNGRKLPDGGVLYDDTDENEDDTEVESDASAAPVPAAIDWNEGDINVSGLHGAELIGEFVKRLPNSPGVYRMFNGDGDVLYVGKARSLKKRVNNYALGRGHSNRIAQMIRQTAHMEFVTTRTEIEALLLEANLIKRLRPRFNVLLRDDKSFPYILITGDHRAPAIFKHRGARARKGEYFGPFASAGAVGRTINSLQRAFLIRTCTDSVFETRTRPCLLYQIKRCSGPCTREINDEGYGFPFRQEPEGESPYRRGNERGSRRSRLRTRRRLPRPPRLAFACLKPPRNQSGRRRRGRCLRHSS